MGKACYFKWKGQKPSEEPDSASVFASKLPQLEQAQTQVNPEPPVPANGKHPRAAHDSILSILSKLCRLIL